MLNCHLTQFNETFEPRTQVLNSLSAEDTAKLFVVVFLFGRGRGMGGRVKILLVGECQ